MGYLIFGTSSDYSWVCEEANGCLALEKLALAMGLGERRGGQWPHFIWDAAMKCLGRIWYLV